MYSNPFALWALPLYSLTETQGERRVNSITSIVGIFNPSPRRYTPRLSPIFFCATHRNASGHGKGRRLNTNDFLSLSKKVLVTLIRFICSFFSAARRTNQEAPPRLSGFWVCRRSRRRGLRNSLRSDSPRPFSSVFLATSPPDKGGDFAHAFAGLFNPSVLADTSPIFCATKHRGGGGDVFRFCPCSDFMSHTPQCCGARQGRSLEVALYSFFFELEYFS